MINKIYIKGNDKNYPPAIRRFLKYVFNKDSSLLEKESVLDNSTVLIDEDSPIDKDCQDLFNKYTSKKIVVLGLSKESNEVYVNLLDLSLLKNNFQNALENKKTGLNPLLLLKNLEQQIRLLFKSHGEKSFFDLINIIKQSVSSGPEILKQNIVSWEEYKKNYLNPGQRNLEAFKRRFRKYKDYLKACGFDNEIDEVESNINNIQKYMDKLKNMTKDQTNQLSDNEIRKNADYLSYIDHISTKIKQKIDAIYNGK